MIRLQLGMDARAEIDPSTNFTSPWRSFRWHNGLDAAIVHASFLITLVPSAVKRRRLPYPVIKSVTVTARPLRNRAAQWAVCRSAIVISMG